MEEEEEEEEEKLEVVGGDVWAFEDDDLSLFVDTLGLGELEPVPARSGPLWPETTTQ